MDKDTLMKLIGPEGFQAMMQHQNQQANPSIDVPEVFVPPPVVLHGELKLQATFPVDAVAGLPYDQIVGKVLDRLQGVTGPWMPDVVIGELKLWRPISGEPERPERNRVPVPTQPDDDGDSGETVAGDQAPYEPGGSNPPE